jgi:transposase
MRMAAQGQWTLEQIALAVDAGRSTVAGWLKTLRERGFAALVSWQPGQGAPGALSVDLQKEIALGLSQGRWRRGVDLQRWLKAEHGIELKMGGIYYYLGKAGGVLKVPRKTHAKKDAALSQAFKEELGTKLAALPLEPNRPVRVWTADEHRFGLISVVRRCWSLRGVRPYAPYHTKYQWGYLYSALEVDGAHGSQALFTSSVNLETSGKFLEQLVKSDPTSQHVVIWDQAGFHPRSGHETIPAGVQVLSLPPYSPELNPVEKIGSFIKDAVCNKVYQTLPEIEAAITTELQPLWQQAQRVAQLIGDGWLPSQLNAFAS